MNKFDERICHEACHRYVVVDWNRHAGVVGLRLFERSMFFRELPRRKLPSRKLSHFVLGFTSERFSCRFDFRFFRARFWYEFSPSRAVRRHGNAAAVILKQSRQSMPLKPPVFRLPAELLANSVTNAVLNLPSTLRSLRDHGRMKCLEFHTLECAISHRTAPRSAGIVGAGKDCGWWQVVFDDCDEHLVRTAVVNERPFETTANQTHAAKFSIAPDERNMSAIHATRTSGDFFRRSGPKRRGSV